MSRLLDALKEATPDEVDEIVRELTRRGEMTMQGPAPEPLQAALDRLEELLPAMSLSDSLRALAGAVSFGLTPSTFAGLAHIATSRIVPGAADVVRSLARPGPPIEVDWREMIERLAIVGEHRLDSTPWSDGNE